MSWGGGQHGQGGCGTATAQRVGVGRIAAHQGKGPREAHCGDRRWMWIAGDVGAVRRFVDVVGPRSEAKRPLYSPVLTSCSYPVPLRQSPEPGARSPEPWICRAIEGTPNIFRNQTGKHTCQNDQLGAKQKQL